MKKILSLLLAITLIFTVVSISATAIVERVDGVIGDADGNGTLSTADARFALKAAAGIAPLDESAVKRCDLDGDGVITIRDARQILRGAIGILELEPHGAFWGFDGGEVFDTPEEAIEYFNTNLNMIKASYSEGGRPSLTKSTSSKITDVNVEATGTTGTLIKTYKDQLFANDTDNNTVVEILDAGVGNYSKISVEEEAFVSLLTANDALGTVVTTDNNVITIKVSLPDTRKSVLSDSGYPKILDPVTMEANSTTTATTILSYMISKDGGTTTYKNGVFEARFNATTGKVIYYKTSYDISISYKSTKGADLLTIVKNITTEYQNFGWPTVQ